MFSGYGVPPVRRSPRCAWGWSVAWDAGLPQDALVATQRRNGRAFSSLTARGGGLPVGVKRTPGTCLFMAFPEGLPGHLQVIQATVQPIWHMDRPPPNIPKTIARAALHAPGRMRDARGHGRVE